jgi:hypothetical protein
MLSEHERRALREIEQIVAAHDPAFAAMLSPRSNRAIRRMRLVYDLVAALAVVLALVCIPLGQVGSGLVALVFGGVVVGVRRRRFSTLAPPQSPTARPGSTKV